METELNDFVSKIEKFGTDGLWKVSEFSVSKPHLVNPLGIYASLKEAELVAKYKSVITSWGI